MGVPVREDACSSAPSGSPAVPPSRRSASPSCQNIRTTIRPYQPDRLTTPPHRKTRSSPLSRERTPLRRGRSNPSCLQGKKFNDASILTRRPQPKRPICGISQSGALPSSNPISGRGAEPPAPSSGPGQPLVPRSPQSAPHSTGNHDTTASDSPCGERTPADRSAMVPPSQPVPSTRLRPRCLAR